MSANYYPQSLHENPPTFSVGDLITALQNYPATLPVIFKSPPYGAFGSGTAYSINLVQDVSLDRSETKHPATSYIDDETGRHVQVEAYVDIRDAWQGVILE